MTLYVDTSALGSVYLGDEADGDWIRELLFSGLDAVVTCELTDVELASLLARAKRDGRISDAGLSERWAAYQAHTSDNGPIAILPLSPATLIRACSFVLQASVRSLDALHLGAARVLADARGDEVTVLTRDGSQAQAAAALGFNLHPRSAG